MEERKSVLVPTWLVQAVTTLLLGLILTGVIALNVRFSRIEKEAAIINTRMSAFEEIYARKIWVHENFEKK